MQHIQRNKKDKKGKCPANKQNCLNIKTKQPQTHETDRQEKTPQEVEEAVECGEKENREDNAGNEERTNPKNKEQGKNNNYEQEQEWHKPNRTTYKKNTTGEKLDSSNTTRIRGNGNAELMTAKQK